MNILLILFVVVIIIAIIITFMNFKSGGAKSDDLSLLCTAFNYQIVGQTIRHRDFIEGCKSWTRIYRLATTSKKAIILQINIFI